MTLGQTETAYDRVVDALRAHGCRTTESNGHGASSTCPAHDDTNPSLSVRRSGDRALVWCHGGCDTRDVLASVELTMADLYDTRSAVYRYDDGRTVSRFFDPSGKKRFAQTGAGATSTLYHLAKLHDVPAGRSVFLVEGEADVHAIEDAGGVATTAPQGADSFHKVDVSPLAGHWVTAIVDRDAGGDKWAEQVAKALQGVAAKYRFVRAKEGKDASDHIAAGHGLTDWEAYQLRLDEPEPTGFHRTIVRRSGLADLPPVEPLIHGVLSRRSAAVLVGPTGVGKSFVALSWACCVGTGLVWLGREVERAPVLYVIGEGASGLNARVTAWERAWRTPVTDEDVVFSVKPDSLLHASVWKELGQEAQDLGAGMIILDTFSSLYPDADETKDAATVTRRLSDLAASTDATAVLVHHPGWGDAERTRGGYQLTANVDEVILLRGTPKSELLQLERIKAKDDALGLPINLRRKTSNGSCIIEAMTAEQVMSEVGVSAESIARETFGDDQFSRAQLRDCLMERLVITKSAAYGHVTALLQSGTVRSIGGTSGRPIYGLAPAPNPFTNQAPF